MKLRPLHDWVIIERDKPVDGLLWVPEKPTNQGRVIAVGPKVKEVSVGHKVQFNPYSGLDVACNDQTWLFINEAEISFTDCRGVQLNYSPCSLPVSLPRCDYI